MFGVQARSSLKNLAFCCMKSGNSSSSSSNGSPVAGSSAAEPMSLRLKSSSATAIAKEPKKSSTRKQLTIRKRNSKRNSGVFIEVANSQEFDEKVMCSEKPVVVDFHANWCNPCKELAPMLESIVAEQRGAIKLAKIDVDEHVDLALDYDVRTIPALVVIKNGKVLNRLVGLQEQDVLRDWIANNSK